MRSRVRTKGVINIIKQQVNVQLIIPFRRSSSQLVYSLMMSLRGIVWNVYFFHLQVCQGLIPRRQPVRFQGLGCGKSPVRLPVHVFAAGLSMDWRNLEPTFGPSCMRNYANMCQIRQTTVAFVFATLSSFKALLHDSASGLLEDWFQIFRMFLGGALHKESTCGVMDGPWSCLSWGVYPAIGGSHWSAGSTRAAPCATLSWNNASQHSPPQGDRCVVR